jgi:hypothetical protein
MKKIVPALLVASRDRADQGLPSLLAVFEEELRRVSGGVNRPPNGSTWCTDPSWPGNEGTDDHD